ncbi:RNA polymerase factor sigma-70 [Burkholderia sp. MR1-5-21]
MAMAEVLERPVAATAKPFRGSHPDLPAGPARRTHGAAVPSAQGALLDVLIAHRAMLVNIARGFVGCASRAEDVVHDVFVKLVDFPNQDAVRQPVAYVTRIVRNASIDACRRQSLENVYHAEEDDGYDVPSPEPTPEAALMTRDALRRVSAALDDLPARSRAAFEMVRLRDETLQSAARALNVSQTLVHFMVRDAERHCAECLDACHRGVACPVFCGGRARRR